MLRKRAINGALSFREGVDKYEFIDLGLPSGTLWCNKNIGQSNENPIGDIFHWPGYDIVNGKYLIPSVYYDIQNTEFDKAKELLGDEYVMPTPTQIRELFSKCEVTDFIFPSTNYLTLNLKGPNGNIITFPNRLPNIEGYLSISILSSVSSGDDYIDGDGIECISLDLVPSTSYYFSISGFYEHPKYINDPIRAVKNINI